MSLPDCYVNITPKTDNIIAIHLTKLLDIMNDVPKHLCHSFTRQTLDTLSSNLHKKNQNHPKYNYVMSIINELKSI